MKASSLLFVPIVLSAASMASAQKVARLTEDLRLDATKEDFPRIWRVVVGPRGQIGVLILPESQVRLYDSTGRRIGSVGRAGSGPGEFRAMSTMGWVGDTLWVADHQLQRTTFIASDGRMLRTTPHPKATMAGASASDGAAFGFFLRPLAVYADGSMLVSGRAVPAGATRAKQFIGVMKPGGSIAPLPGAPDFDDPRYFMTVGGLSRPVPLLVIPQSMVMADGSRYGLLVVENTSSAGGVIRLTSYRRDGSLALKKEIPFRGEPAPARVRDSLVGAHDLRGRNSDATSSMDRRFQQIARDRMPSFYPPVEGTRYGLDGSIWLNQRIVDDQQTFRVLDARGNEVGQATLPKRARLAQATLSTAWVVQRDEDDLPSVVRYRLDWQK